MRTAASLTRLPTKSTAARSSSCSSTRSTRRAGTTSDVHPAVRAARHAQYDAYLRHELVPYIFNRAQRGDLAVYGASFGAYHAANFAARYPDVVSRAICFSGIYDIHASARRLLGRELLLQLPDRLHPEHGRRVGGQALAHRLGHRHRRVRHDRRQEPRVLVDALVERDPESPRDLGRRLRPRLAVVAGESAPVFC